MSQEDQIENELIKRSGVNADRIKKSLATDAGQFLYSVAVSTWVVKTLAELKTLIGLGDYVPYTGSAANVDLGVYEIKAKTAKFGVVSDYTEFEADGTMVAKGAAVCWNDAFVDAMSLQGGATDPPIFVAFNGTIYGRRFDNATIMSAHGTIELPHDYVEGTDFDLHIHWSPSTTNTGNCRWGVEWCVGSINGVFGAVTTSYIIQAGAGVLLSHQAINVVTISGTGRKISDVICFRVFRDGNNAADTFTGNSFLHRIAVHYQCDTLGSRQELIK